jgi:ATP-dependent helicase/nuclease subunit A
MTAPACTSEKIGLQISEIEHGPNAGILASSMNILESNLLILASAGSGKTHQLGSRVIGLVASGVAPEKIVALTFTRKAAGEFADSILTRLAQAAVDVKVAEKLSAELKLQQVNFSEVLERVVRALPRFTLGTMDSFFSSVVRGFQYELGLTGGKFDLLEGSRAAAMGDEILAELLSETLEEGGGDDFLQAFRRATIGKEGQGVEDSLRNFVGGWQQRYRATSEQNWAPTFLSGVKLEDWEKHKHELVAKVLRGLDGVEFTRKGQREALEKAIEALEAHTIGSGSLGSATGLLASIFSASQTNDGALTLKFHKEFILGGPGGDALREMVNLAAGCEMAAALVRTLAVREVVAVHDERCEKQLRRRGLLGFDDVKILMAEWVKSEDARLRRELIDFRLGARYNHWLLDEFQDTSRSDWMGLLPLMEEAASDNESSLFIVGDKKQAIYGWRGGEVKLFDEVIERWKIEPEKMSDSWRSCPEVLELVNRVCGDTTTMHELFGEAAAKWDWQDHVSTENLTHSEKRGEARVEVVEGKREERFERLSELLDELQIREREMVCGVLVRSNSQVSEVADYLRAKGFVVIEEGRREPSLDNPVGIALSHLLKWLANPADAFAKEVVEMSPLAAVLHKRFGEHWQQVWEGLLGLASEAGFSEMIRQVVDACSEIKSNFGLRRAEDLMTALASLDAMGGATAQEAADWIDRLEVSQSPGIAAVQVMTIHKSKGLGFDVVILPEISKDRIPDFSYFDVAEGDGWLSQTPPKWARGLIPEMSEAETRWAVGQCYEAFCMLYVALTRAKRGLYVLLEPPAKSQVEDKASLANWMMRSVCEECEIGVIYQSGSPDWIENVPLVSHKIEAQKHDLLGGAIARRVRTTPSATKEKLISQVSDSPHGMAFGSEVHAIFERVGWVDEAWPQLPSNDAGRLVGDVLKSPKLAHLFNRHSRRIELFREQAIDAILDGKWLSGIMDRLHLHRDHSGTVIKVEVIDFKTDAISEISALAEKYSGQMHAYREAMQRAYPQAKVECILLSTHHRDLVSL